MGPGGKAHASVELLHQVCKLASKRNLNEIVGAHEMRLSQNVTHHFWEAFVHAAVGTGN